MWTKRRGAGHEVVRCMVERLYRENGWEGAHFGSRHTTAHDPDETRHRHPDLVDPDFGPVAPNRRWVADFTCVSNVSGPPNKGGLRTHRGVTPRVALHREFFLGSTRGCTNLDRASLQRGGRCRRQADRSVARVRRVGISQCRRPGAWMSFLVRPLPSTGVVARQGRSRRRCG